MPQKKQETDKLPPGVARIRFPRDMDPATRKKVEGMLKQMSQLSEHCSILTRKPPHRRPFYYKPRSRKAQEQPEPEAE